MNNPNYTSGSSLSVNQEQVLAEIARERFGGKLSRRQFVDRLHLVCEDIAGFEAGELPKDAVHRIWAFYEEASG